MDAKAERLISIALGKTPHIILSCKLVPFQCKQYKYDLSLGLCYDPQQSKQDSGSLIRLCQ